MPLLAFACLWPAQLAHSMEGDTGLRPKAKPRPRPTRRERRSRSRSRDHVDAALTATCLPPTPPPWSAVDVVTAYLAECQWYAEQASRAAAVFCDEGVQRLKAIIDKRLVKAEQWAERLGAGRAAPWPVETTPRLPEPHLPEEPPAPTSPASDHERAQPEVEASICGSPNACVYIRLSLEVCWACSMHCFCCSPSQCQLARSGRFEDLTPASSPSTPNQDKFAENLVAAINKASQDLKELEMEARSLLQDKIGAKDDFFLKEPEGCTNLQRQQTGSCQTLGLWTLQSAALEALNWLRQRLRH